MPQIGPFASRLNIEEEIRVLKIRKDAVHIFEVFFAYFSHLQQRLAYVIQSFVSPFGERRREVLQSFINARYDILDAQNPAYEKKPKSGMGELVVTKSQGIASQLI